ncbi:MAG TPA: alpha/beta fold hydrolase [Phnomibacter sp.]|nr:alpha/beta fold hydrolase [Phnomibacter sp.]
MHKLTRIFRVLGIIAVIACIAYLLGPDPIKPRFDPTLPEITVTPEKLDSMVAAEENRWKIKPGNEAQIVWYDTATKTPTEYAIVYLHGFSASHEEGNPTHRTIANTFGCNMYLSRLCMHGIDTTEQLLGLTADCYWETAKEALAIGKKLGQKVILMGTSTGGTQALQLAAAFPNDVAGLILLSPNIAINDPRAWMLNNPWGLQVARLALGGHYVVARDTRAIYKKYWNTPYRIEATVELQEMLEATMKASTFQRITQPLLLMYYYKDEENQDKVVRVDAMRKMYLQVATPISLKREVAIPEAGDHVIGGYIKSKDVQSVIDACSAFLQDVMKLQVRQNDDLPVHMDP